MPALPPADEKRPLGIYVHWPFCEAICPYCDFNVARGRNVDERAWADAFLAELTHMRSKAVNHVVESIYFGGGTPSLMTPQTVCSLIGRIKSLWDVRDDCEVSLEANPTHAETERFTALAEAGVTRLSLGIQALNDKDLKRLGRRHSRHEARRAFDKARPLFDVVSIDLIYGRPGQSCGDWSAELGGALSWRPPHLSLYQLTIEPGTAFWTRRARGALAMPTEEELADLYEVTQDLCERAGLSAYEVSNHARAGFQCRHNLGYWRSQDYVGVGPGAHGRLTVHATRYAAETVRKPREWLRQVARRGHAVRCWEALPAKTQAAEWLLMGLRLSSGVSLAEYERIAAAPLAEDRVSELEDRGLVCRGGGRLHTTKRGRAVLDRVVEALAP